MNSEKTAWKKNWKESDFVLDLHTHSCASGHAYGTIREMAQAAKNKKLQLLGISEHAPGIPGTCHPIYFSNLHVAPRNYQGVALLYGSEINVLNDGTLSLDQNEIEYLDYAIIGIHRQCYQDAGREKNTDHVISCMKNRKVCLVSHPDDDHTPLDYERLVQAAGKYHVALELNNSSLWKQEQRINCVENYKTMLGLCRRYRVPILVSSDAHDPDYVGGFALACELLNEIGFDPDLVLNTSVEKLNRHLDARKEREICERHNLI